MFCGEYGHSLDAKNRVMLPAKLRDQLGEQVVLTKAVDKCISLYTTEKWKEFTDKLAALPSVETRQVKRFLYSAAYDTPVDGQGRVLIDNNLCTYAGLTKSVVIVGVGDHIEIWDEALWNEENSAENSADIADLLMKLGF